MKINELAAEIEALNRRTQALPRFEWGTVTGIAPLTVITDVDPTPVAGVSTISPVIVGDRVRLERQGPRVTIVGIAGQRIGEWSTGVENWFDSKLTVTPSGPVIVAAGFLTRVGGVLAGTYRRIGRIPTRYGPAQTIYGEAGVALSCVTFKEDRARQYKNNASFIIDKDRWVNLALEEASDRVIISGHWLSEGWLTSFEGSQHARTWPTDGTNFRKWFADHGMIEGTNFVVDSGKGSNPNVASIAIHGGDMEHGSQEIAEEVAKMSGASFYTLDGITGGYENLHISSNGFDDPRATGLVRRADRTLSFHGAIDLAGDDGVKMTYVGGRDTALRHALIARLQQAGFHTRDAMEEPIPALQGGGLTNICNLGANGGVQVEMSATQRKSFFTRGNYYRHNRGNRTQDFDAYVEACLKALEDVGA